MRAEIFGTDDPKWSETLGRLRHDFYHLPEYSRMEGQRLDARPEALSIREGDREIFVPYLVRSCRELAPHGDGDVSDVVSPYGYPGVLVSEAGRDADFMGRALAAWRAALAERGVCSGFFRMNPILDGNLADLAPSGCFTDSGETVAFDLALDEHPLWRGVRETHRTTIRRCRDAGFAVREVSMAEQFEPFLDIYRQTMNRVKAESLYYFPRSYFEHLARMTENVFLLATEHDGSIAALCLFSECQGIVQAHLGGTDDRYLSKSPFHLLLFEAALWAKRRGNRYLHLGGGLGGKSDHLLTFKGGFSSTRFRFRTHRMIANEAVYRRLVEQQAQRTGGDCETLLRAEFFPAYRAP